MRYEPVIGLEVHVQLQTATKLFCRCPNRFGEQSNTLVCPICLGYPGTLPSLNQEAVNQGVVLALSLESSIQETSCFARKSYFYPDLPKGYQITQFEHPLAIGGRLPLSRHHRTVELRRIHLEEDAGKLLHDRRKPGEELAEGQVSTRVDFNRCGVPLIEIVSEPQMRSVEEAQDYLRSLRQILLYTRTSEACLERGHLRCDANISVRSCDSRVRSRPVEIKNLNSFRHLGKALTYEFRRQCRLLEAGRGVQRETRSFDAGTCTTSRSRFKESARDYRYVPEPDLQPLKLSRSRLERLARALPESPDSLRRRLQNQYQLSLEDTFLLTSTPQLATYFEAANSTYPDNPRAIAGFIKTELLGSSGARRSGNEVSPQRLAMLVRLVDRDILSASAAKKVFAAMARSSASPKELADRLGLIQLSDEGQTRGWILDILREHPAQVAEYRSGKSQLLGFFMGRLMRLSGGRANPGAARRMLREALGETRLGADTS